MAGGRKKGVREERDRGTADREAGEKKKRERTGIRGASPSAKGSGGTYLFLDTDRTWKRQSSALFGARGGGGAEGGCRRPLDGRQGCYGLRRWGKRGRSSGSVLLRSGPLAPARAVCASHFGGLRVVVVVVVVVGVLAPQASNLRCPAVRFQGSICAGSSGRVQLGSHAGPSSRPGLVSWSWQPHQLASCGTARASPKSRSCRKRGGSGGRKRKNNKKKMKRTLAVSLLCMYMCEGRAEAVNCAAPCSVATSVLPRGFPTRLSVDALNASVLRAALCARTVP